MSRVPSNAVSAPLFAMGAEEVRLRAGSFDPTASAAELMELEEAVKQALELRITSCREQRLSGEDAWFETFFWPAWPVKENKANARKAAAKIPAHKRPQVLDGLRRQAAAIAAMERPIHAATWINGERWEDEVVHRGNDATSQALAIVEGRIERGERPL